MFKLSLVVACISMALMVAESAHARGNTSPRSDPYVQHPDKHKTHSGKPVRIWSSAHGHYHVTYHPNE
jgi:hypothetical protein